MQTECVRLQKIVIPGEDCESFWARNWGRWQGQDDGRHTRGTGGIIRRPDPRQHATTPAELRLRGPGSTLLRSDDSISHCCVVPKISEFFGIAIYMYYDDHAPPHFHARYGGRDAAFDIETNGVLFGDAGVRAR